MQRKNRALEILRWGLILIFVFGSIFPFYFAILNSFRLVSRIPDLGWLPTQLTLRNWVTAFSEGSMIPRWTFNSLFVTLCITILAICTDTLAAYAFSRKRFPGRKLLLGLIIFGLTIPQAVLIIPVFFIMAKAGLINTYIALILPAASALGVFMMTQSMKSIPVELDEAAFLDGCNDFQVLKWVILPLLKPALASLSIILFLDYWNWFLYPLIVTTTLNMRTLPVGLYIMAPPGDAGTYILPNWGLIMVIMTIMVAPVLVIFTIFQDYFTKGIALTGFR